MWTGASFRATRRAAAAVAPRPLTSTYTSCIKTRVSPDDYRRALDAAIAEYEALGARRREIDARLAQLAQTIGTLNRLCGFVPSVPWGLTDACRLVLRNAGVPLTPTDVRDRLASIGFDLSRYVNELASIHTVLKRLHDAGELRLVPRTAGSHAYIATGAARAIAMSLEDVHAMLAAPGNDAPLAAGPPRPRAPAKSRKKTNK